MAKAESNKAEIAGADTAKADLPPQPAGHGTGNGLLGVLPASSLAPSSASQAMAYADPNPRSPPQPAPQNAPSSRSQSIPAGSFRSARSRAKTKRCSGLIWRATRSHGLLAKADPFTEPVVAKGDRKLFRARFAGLDRDQAEAVCRTLRRSDISCITVRN